MIERLLPVARLFVFIFVSAVGLIGILGKTSPSPPPSPAGSCPNIYVGTLTQPTSALAWVWGFPGSSDVVTPVLPGQNSGAAFDREWSLVNRSGAEEYFNVEYAPQIGWPIPPDTRGLAFDMKLSEPGIYSVAYVLEYTLPEFDCQMNMTWEADISITLPNGVCFTDSGFGPAVGGTACPTVVRGGYADFVLFALGDPEGTMAVIGNGRDQLEAAIRDELSVLPTNDEWIRVDETTSSQLRERKLYVSDIEVDANTAAHVYVGVSAQFRITGSTIFDAGKAVHISTGNFDYTPDNLDLEALFLIEGGSSDGVIGIAGSRSN